MNEYNFEVSFEKGKIRTNLKRLVKNDYNTTKLIFTFDKQGRINLPSSLISYANLGKECTIIGVNDRLEIWATDKFDSLIEDNLEVISDISENLFEGFDIDA